MSRWTEDLAGGLRTGAKGLSLTALSTARDCPLGEVGLVPSAAVKTAAMRSEPLPAVFQRYRSAIDRALRANLSRNELPLHHMIRYAMGWADVDGNERSATDGKALRPTLCLLACEATGGRAGTALPGAVSLELIHRFSLIHDDIQDRDKTRHHRPTLWAVWGEPKSLVAGNALRVIADMALWGLVAEGLDFEDALIATGLLTEAYLLMIEGQYMDISYEGRPDIGIRDYLEMISRKTGALIECSLTLGALIGTQDAGTVEAFRRCGRSLGFVFQIRDDVLGIWGDEDSTGKPVGADIRRKKNTLPVVYAMSRAEGADAALLREIYGGESVADKDVSSVLEVMDRVKAMEFAQNLASEHAEQATDALAAMELATGARDEIEELTHFLLVREH